MIELRDYQKKAVSELKQRIVEMLNEQDDRQRLIFKAPTGSGKTVMVSSRATCPSMGSAATRVWHGCG